MIYLITKLVNVGVFPSTVPTWHSQPSFFATTGSTVRTKLQSSPEYASKWQHLLSSFPSTLTLQSVLTSLFSHFSSVEGLEDSPHARALVKREARLLKALLGRFTKDSDIVDGFSVTALGRQWSVGHARIFACWISGTEKGKVDTEGRYCLGS